MDIASLDGNTYEHDRFYSRTFSRHRGLVNDEDLFRLKNPRIAIPGMGGLRGLYGATLARTGIGKFSIADFDQFDVHNINRQYGAMASTTGIVAAEIASYIFRRKESEWVPHFTPFDTYDRSYKRRHRRRSAKNPVQRLRYASAQTHGPDNERLKGRYISWVY